MEKSTTAEKKRKKRRKHAHAHIHTHMKKKKLKNKKKRVLFHHVRPLLLCYGVINTDCVAQEVSGLAILLYIFSPLFFFLLFDDDDPLLLFQSSSKKKQWRNTRTFNNARGSS